MLLKNHVCLPRQPKAIRVRFINTVVGAVGPGDSSSTASGIIKGSINELIEGVVTARRDGRIRRRLRLGGLLNYYSRAV